MNKPLTFILLFLLISLSAHAHRSGCHSKHSCPSDNQSYICGDIGHCSQCPDNLYCKDGQPRSTETKNFLAPSYNTPQSGNLNTSSPNYFRTVIHVIDGDTLVLDGNEKVRLIGVDTPESVHRKKPVEYFGKEAAAFTTQMVEGKKVRLEFEKKSKDLYGRSLAYVYLQDGTFLNAEIIKQGYGFAYTKFPFKWKAQFRHYERDARVNHRGMWKSKSSLVK